MKKIDFSKDLNKEQYRAATAAEGPHLVLAGAGSGKTRTLVYRVAWLLSQGVKPEKILLLTFTNKAANEMISRVRSLLGISNKQKLSLWSGTFHSLANRLLRIYGEHVALEKDFTIIDADDSKALINKISKEFFNEGRWPSKAILAEVISFAVNSDISIAESLERKFPEWLHILEYFEKIATEYKKRKRAANLLDFDDLLLYWYRLSKDSKIGKLLSNKWEYILVDEYQDTNTLQAKIIFNLAREHKNILVVGDDAQSIYSFRAADIQNILSFPTLFKNCRTYKLETNYRSTPEIVDLANVVISGNQNQFAKNLRAVLESYTRPELIALRTNIEEAQFIANRIEGLLADGLSPDEIAVLFRAGHHSQSLEMELNKRGIYYEMRGGIKFFERAHIKDVVSFLRILSNYKDEVSWQRILQLYENIGPATADKIYQEILTTNSLDNLVDLKINIGSQKTLDSFKQCRNIFQQLLQHKDKNSGQLIDVITKGYQDYLKEKYIDYLQRLDDLEQLAVFASNFKNLDEFLSEVSLQENFNIKEDKNIKGKSVVLSTVHQAKGLEWPAVFVMNITNQSFPHPLCTSEEEIEEERRLFYVAITRAQKYLYLTYPLAVYSYNNFKQLQPSEFITGLKSDLFNYNDLARSATYASEDGVEYVSDPDSQDYNSGDGFLPDVSDW